MQTKTYSVEVVDLEDAIYVTFSEAKGGDIHTCEFEGEEAPKRVAEELIADLLETQRKEEACRKKDKLPLSFVTEGEGDIVAVITAQVTDALAALKRKGAMALNQRCKLVINRDNSSEGSLYGNDVYLYSDDIYTVCFSDKVYLGDPCYFKGNDGPDDNEYAELPHTLPGKYFVFIERAEDNRRPCKVYILHEHYYSTRYARKFIPNIFKTLFASYQVLPVDSGKFGIYDRDTVGLLESGETYDEICRATCTKYITPDICHMYNAFVTSTHNGDGSTSVSVYKDNFGRAVGFIFRLP